MIVLHAWWGLNEDVRARAENLRREGYLVEAPDLYNGRVVATITEAEALSSALDEAGGMPPVEAALATLRARADRVAVLGWSRGVWGRTLAFLRQHLSEQLPRHADGPRSLGGAA